MPPCETDPARPGSIRTILLCAVALAAATVAAYHNSFTAPLLFDDIPAIRDNRSIRDLWRLSDVLNPAAGGNTVSGRPILNLSFALCHAMSGAKVWSYHALNLAIHLGAALTLFGVVRRTLRSPRAAESGFIGASRPSVSHEGACSDENPLRTHATPVACSIALLWALHPLQTEAVTYISQRAESLMGLFFLLSFYAFVRALDSARTWLWDLATVAACLLGMGTKEVAVCVPVLLFLYDRCFVAGSFRAAWLRRRRLYVVLAATWLPLLYLVAATGWNRGGTSMAATAPWHYWLTQFQALYRYLSLSIWPHPLVFDYATFSAGWTDAAPYALIVLPLLAATIVALWRWPAAGFLGVWFFAILSPTSVVPGIYQMIAEHRMYLPLAAVVTFVACAAVKVAGQRSIPALLALAVAAGVVSEQRNRTYRDDLTLWADTVSHSPSCEIAHGGFGTALLERNRVTAALEQFQVAARLNPTSATARYNLGLGLLRASQPLEAEAQFAEAVRLKPNWAEADFQRGFALYQLNRAAEAFACFRAALRADPELQDIHFSLGLALSRMGRRGEALKEYAEAVRLSPGTAMIQFNLGVALREAGQLPAALEHLEQAARLDPTFAQVHRHLGLVLVALGRPNDAILQYREALRLDPNFAEAESDLAAALCSAGQIAEGLDDFRRALEHNPRRAQTHFEFGSALARLGSLGDATAQFAEAVRLEPENPSAQLNLGIALARAGRTAEAVERLRQSVKLDPAAPGAHCNLGLALTQLGRPAEAIDEFQTALQLRPDYAEAHFGLGSALFALSRMPEARSHFEAALRINANFTPAREMLNRFGTAP